jgi:AraC-like DNA-binding protein/mannose-6-phosphate isomerase-like protein (cupin superfamily)
MEVHEPTKHDRCPVEVIRGEGLPEVEVHRGIHVRDAFEPHFHSFAHITYVLAGARRQSVGRRRFTLKAGDLLVIPPHEVHNGASAGREGWTFAAIYCSPAAVDQAREGLTAPVPPRQPRALGFHLASDPHCGRLVGALIEAMRESPLAAQTTWLELVACLLREGGRASPHRRERAMVKTVREFLDAHLAEPVTLDRLVDVTGVTKEHLVRSFTADFGLPPHAYHINARIEHAKRLLLVGTPISEVALALGFHDQSHFTRHFRRIVGVPPRRFAGLRGG